MKFNFLIKIINISNICYFLRIFQNIYRQMTSKHFCDNFQKQSKTSYTTSPQSKPPLLSSSSNIAFKTDYDFFFNWRAGEIALCSQCFQCFYSKASNESLLSLSSYKRTNGSILRQCYSELSWIYLFLDTDFNFSVNTIILNATIVKYLTETAIFEDGF